MGRIDKFLQQRKQHHLLRILTPADLRKEGKIYFSQKQYIDLSSNDYLGLSGHPKLKLASKKAIQKYGTSSSASRLLSGDLNLHHQLEERVARFKGKPKALVFNSGYQANLGIISTLCSRGDVIFTDRLSHASIVDGILLSGARLFRFSHNDLNHLELLLKKNRSKFKQSLIITETIFSMDGDRPPLKELVYLKQKYSSKLMVDEAHATGIFGENGSGVVEEEGLIDKVDLIMGTFSKGLGSFGAYIAGPSKLIDYLINSARSFIYSTALPPAIVAVNLASLDLITKEPFRRKRLLTNSNYFRERLKTKGFKVKGSSCIVPLILGSNKRVIKAATLLREKGYWVFPIRPPTVPPGEARLRFSLTYHHNKKILTTLIDNICETINDAKVYQ